MNIIDKYLRGLFQIQPLATSLALVLVVGSFQIVGGQSNTDAIKVQELFSAGNTLLANGRVNEAIEKYNQAIAIAPNMSSLYLNRGVANISISKISEAQVDADKALSLFLTGTHAPRNIAIAYQIKGLVNERLCKYDLAVEFYSKAIELDPMNAKYRNGRGNAYRLLKDYDSSLKDFDSAIKADPSQSIFYINRSAIKRHLKDFNGSLDDLFEALRLDKQNASAYYGRANTYIELKRFDEALKDFDVAISLKPKSEYYHGRARLYSILGKHGLSIKDNSEAINLDPANAEAYGNRAVAYSRVGEYNLAIEDVRKAIGLKADSAINRYRLGYLLFQVGKFPEAVNEATHAIRMSPGWRDPYLLRASSYVKLGAIAKAREDQQTAAKLNHGNGPTDDYVVFTIHLGDPKNIDQ